MKVLCELENILKEDNRWGLPVGEYLFIYSEKQESPYVMPFIEFKNFFQEAKRSSSFISSDPQINNKEKFVPISKKSNKPDFSKIINHLKNKININDDDFNDDKKELLIESRFGSFLELPWEEITGNEIFVIRRVIGCKKCSPVESLNNFLFVISNSNISTSGAMPDLKDKLKGEILKIIDIIIEVIPKEFKVDNINISKHTTVNTFKSLAWSDYNYVHMIMHGDEDSGGLCLEDPDLNKYKYQKIMTINDVIATLSDKLFLLLFFSFCFSGGGSKYDNDSLAFNIIEKGISKYVIGYRYGVKEVFASSFSEIFYKNLLNRSSNDRQNKLEDVYKKSLSEYYKIENSNTDVPILYANY